ncbi:hypothetical protein AVEN_137567-1 [Araneus ventricosus]|uniref:Uncharacterized protein n=1 Tax=Araneus ventricosus TaxID=182803 RepID=A0A4Y2WW33_ARAVE|nr:hypothetical protein AVEN_137567-1 [Araneus ventricosus]
MLHAAFQNINCACLISTLVGGFSSTHSSPSESSTFIAWPYSQTVWQISKSVSVAATGMSSSMDIHPSYSSFCIPSEGSMKITNGHASACEMDDLQREVMKNKPRNSWDVWGKVAPRCFLTSAARNSTNVNR